MFMIIIVEVVSCQPAVAIALKLVYITSIYNKIVIVIFCFKRVIKICVL